MSEEKTFRLAFAGFECEIAGFDEPVAVLRRAIAVYAEAAAACPAIEGGGGPAPAELRARFVEAVASRFDAFEGAVAVSGGRVTISRRAAPAAAVEPPPGVGRMEPGVLAEFAALRARLREDEAEAEAAPKAPAEPRRPTVRVLRPDQAPKAPDARPAARAPAPAPVAAAPRRANPFLGDNFLFSEAPEAERAAAAPLTLAPADRAPPPRPAFDAPEPEDAPARRFGFLRGAVPPELAPEAGPGEEAGFHRLRETAEAALPRLDPVRRPSASAPEPRLSLVPEAPRPADGPESFAAGAASLTRMVEAAAAWLAVGEGRARFSRRDAMAALARIPASRDFTPEARIKAFRNLLKEGALSRDDDGLYSLSAAARFGYETRRRA